MEPWHEVVASRGRCPPRHRSSVPSPLLPPEPRSSRPIPPAQQPIVPRRPPVESVTAHARAPLTGLAYCRRAAPSASPQGALDIPVESAPFAVALIDLDGFQRHETRAGLPLMPRANRLAGGAARRLGTCLRAAATPSSASAPTSLADPCSRTCGPRDAPRIGDLAPGRAQRAHRPTRRGPCCPQASVGSRRPRRPIAQRLEDARQSADALSAPRPRAACTPGRPIRGVRPRAPTPGRDVRSASSMAALCASAVEFRRLPPITSQMVSVARAARYDGLRDPALAANRAGCARR